MKLSKSFLTTVAASVVAGVLVTMISRRVLKPKEPKETLV